MSRPTICLAMIVRDEAHIIKRCLTSVLPYIDHWIVSDTGSVDNTCVVTRAFMADAGIPGKVIHRPWIDFGHNRTIALQAAARSGCDYTLVIDADEVLVVDDASVLEGLQHDAYRVEMRFPGISYPRVNLMRSARNFRYVGRIHEYATADPHPVEFMLDPSKIHMWTDGDGARGRSGTKQARDVAIMQQWVVDEPDNPRAWFYLAQGFETVNRLNEALAAYTKRSMMGDYAAEVWFCHYRMGRLCDIAGNWPGAQLHYLDAYQHSPHRAEPLFWLGVAHHNRQQDNIALLYLEQATLLDKPVSDLFVEPAIYHHLAHMQYAICLYNTGKHGEAQDMARELLKHERVPDAQRPVIEAIAGIKEAVAP